MVPRENIDFCNYFSSCPYWLSSVNEYECRGVEAPLGGLDSLLWPDATPILLVVWEPHSEDHTRSMLACYTYDGGSTLNMGIWVGRCLVTRVSHANLLACVVHVRNRYRLLVDNGGELTRFGNEVYVAWRLGISFERPRKIEFVVGWHRYTKQQTVTVGLGRLARLGTADDVDRLIVTTGCWHWEVVRQIYSSQYCVYLAPLYDCFAFGNCYIALIQRVTHTHTHTHTHTVYPCLTSVRQIHFPSYAWIRRKKKDRNGK